MLTTTFADIRARYVGLLEALTPQSRQESGRKFRLAPAQMTLRDWAVANPQACFRHFGFLRVGPKIDTPSYDPQALRRDVAAELVVAYPANESALYGRSELYDLEDLIDSDARQLRDVLASGDNLVAGQQSSTQIEVNPPERGEVYFLPILVQLAYFEGVGEAE